MSTPMGFSAVPGVVESALQQFSYEYDAYGPYNPKFEAIYGGLTLMDSVARNLPNGEGGSRERTPDEAMAMQRRGSGNLQETTARYFFMYSGVYQSIPKSPYETVTLREDGYMEATKEVACPRHDSPGVTLGFHPGVDPTGLLETMLLGSIAGWANRLFQEHFYNALVNGRSVHKVTKNLECYDDLALFHTAHKCSTKNQAVTATYSNDLEITQKDGERGWYSFKDKLLDIKGWDGLTRVHADSPRFRVIVSNNLHALWWYRFVTGGATPKDGWIQPYEVPNVGVVGIMLARAHEVEIIVDPELSTHAVSSQDEIAYVRPMGSSITPFVCRYGGTTGWYLNQVAERNCEIIGARSWLEFGLHDPRGIIRLKVKKA